jgi:RNA-directed DNA polymerase
MNSTSTETFMKWSKMKWSLMKAKLFRIQTAIYQAQLNGNTKRVRYLQEIVLNAPTVKKLAVHKVLSSRGGRTGGIDRVNKKNLTDRQKFELANSLSIDGKSSGVVRVWIPNDPKKPLTGDNKRPLGIPTIKDRAKQALALFALEPEWEAKFEPHSYGFRPGRSTKDALKQIRTCILHQEKYVYDADVAKCFDSIDHAALLAKMGWPPGSNVWKQVKAWLEAGIIENAFTKEQLMTPSSAGTPQGGVISPLLANIALHGLENAVLRAVYSKCPNRKKTMDQTKVIRYADDFVILCPTELSLQVAITAAKDFLATVGLQIKNEKTRTLHTIDRTLCPDGDNRFNFLGHTFQCIPVGKYKRFKASGGRTSPYRVRLLPSRKNLTKIKDKLKTVAKKCRNTKQLIPKLNPIISGWARAFNFSDAQTYGVTASLDQWLYLLVKRWQKRQYHTHKRLPTLWRTSISLKGKANKWTLYYVDKFKTVDLYTFGKVTSYSVTKYAGIQASKSPYDGDWAYWSIKLANYIGNGEDTLRGRLMKIQKGYCPLCGQKILTDDVLDVDHRIPKALGGKDSISNRQLIHLDCHKLKTPIDLKQIIPARNSKEKQDSKKNQP